MRNILSSINRKRMIHSSLDSSQWDELNGGKFMSLRSIDDKIFWKVHLMLNENNFLSIDPRDINLLPFDSSHYNESNELYFIILRSIDDKLPWHFRIIVKNNLFNFCMLKCEIFYRLLIVRGWNTARWIRHNETNPISCIASFHDR